MSISAVTRNAQVFGTSLTEMILVLLFVVFFVAASSLSDSSITETERSDLRKKLAEMERVVADLRADIDSVKRKLALREDQIDVLLAALGTKPLSRADPKFDEQLKNIVSKYREKGGSGGEGKRNCLTTGNRVLTIEMEDGFATSTRSWRDIDDDRVRLVPSINELSDAGRAPSIRKITKATVSCLCTVAKVDVLSNSELSVTKKFLCK